MNAKNNAYEAFCCERKHECKWQGFVLHQGIGWGNKDHPSRSVWRNAHDKYCGGKLISLSENPVNDLAGPHPAGS